jgi:hypothetical protein
MRMFIVFAVAIVVWDIRRSVGNAAASGELRLESNRERAV